MIPTIETIVADLVAGRIRPDQAVAWLYQHAETAYASLRDDFAASALTGLMAHGTESETWAEDAISAYLVADAMMAARSKP